MTSTAIVDYTSRDFDSLKTSLLSYAATVFPDWVPGSEGDFGVLLVELLAYVGDVNSYYIDRAQNEAYLSTASQAYSVLQIASLLGYTPGTGAPATGTITFVASDTTRVAGSPAIPIPAGTQVSSDYIAAIDGQVVFETDALHYLTPGNTLTVSVTEGQTQADPETGDPIPLTEATGLPDQTYKIPRPRVYVETVEVYVAGTAWRKVDHLLDADYNDNVFETYNDANGYTWILFGDGINGAVPAVGLTVATIYRTGFGSAGNLAAGQVTSMFSTDIPGVTIQKSTLTSGLTTSSATSGGADPETIEQVRQNAPKTFFTQQRAVTLADFENFALGVPGVAKANSVANFFSSVTVYIMGPDGGTPTTALRDKVATSLNAKALAGVTVSVSSPTAVAVNLGASGGSEIAVQVWDNYSRTDVAYQVTQALSSLLAFSSIDLGMKLTVADVYQTIMNVPGVRFAAIPLMARADAVQTGTADIQFQAFEYPVAGNIVITSTGGIG